MKRYKSIFAEKFLDAFQAGIDRSNNPIHVEIFENPTYNEYKQLTIYVNYKEVKGLLDLQGNLFVWSTPNFHQDIVDQMKWHNKQLVPIEIKGTLRQEAIVDITVTSAILSNLSNEEKIDLINSNKILKSLFSDVMAL